MNKMHNQSTSIGKSETSNVTLHRVLHYDTFANLLGMGVNRSNSRRIVELGKIKPGDAVLDVGCGTGNLTLTAKRYTGATGTVYGIDASPEMIEAARKKAKSSGLEINFEVQLIEKLAFPDANFDVVISRLVIHHLPETIKAKGFAEILRVLKPGGLFVIADFTPPTNHVLAHIATAIIGPEMMKSNVGTIAPLMQETGFIDVNDTLKRSPLLSYVIGKKPIIADMFKVPESGVKINHSR